MNNIERRGGYSGSLPAYNEAAQPSKCRNIFKAAALGMLLVTGGAFLTARRDNETPYDPDACHRPGCLSRNMEYVEFHPTNPLLPVRNVFEQAIYNDEQQICDKSDAWKYPREIKYPPLPSPVDFYKYLNAKYSCKANHSLTVEESDMTYLKQNQLIDNVLKPLKNQVDSIDTREHYSTLTKAIFERLKNGDHSFKPVS